MIYRDLNTTAVFSKRFRTIDIKMKFNTMQNVCCRVLHCVRDEKWIYHDQLQKIRYCIIVLQIQCMIQLSIWFDRHVVRLTYIDINMDIVYL